MISKNIAIGTYVVHAHYTGAGQRTSIVLVHGIGVSSEYYLPLADALAPFFNVIMIDLPGYGKTPKPPSPLTIPELAMIVTKFCKDHVEGPVVLVGQSMGCQIVAHAIAENPLLFEKAVLISPTVYKKERTVLIQAIRLFQDTFRESWKANKVVFRNYARMGVRRYVKTSLFMVGDTIETTLRNNAVITLIISGSRDPIVPKEWVTYLSSSLPMMQAIEIANAPHLVHFAAPKDVATSMIDFISP